MVVARKSAVSTRSTWLEQNSTLPVGHSSSTSTNESTVVSSRRKRRTARKNVLVSPFKNTVTTPTQELSTNSTVQTNERLPMMSPTASLPVWLLRLYTVNRYSSVVAFLCVVAALMVYGWTVYSQELWSQAYRRLQNLQRYERQLTTTNATLKSKMAEEGEKATTELVSPSPEGTIFLPPASHSSQPASSLPAPNSETQQQSPLPLGY
ncbi:MAG TPA: hypothetical protein VK203_14145 [Nostocaceae cyanobacterium]|nr:hypothetical protein [Nostocaceae cyanobacterium]